MGPDPAGPSADSSSWAPCSSEKSGGMEPAEADLSIQSGVRRLGRRKSASEHTLTMALRTEAASDAVCRSIWATAPVDSTEQEPLVDSPMGPRRAHRRPPLHHGAEPPGRPVMRLARRGITPSAARLSGRPAAGDRHPGVRFHRFRPRLFGRNQPACVSV